MNMFLRVKCFFNKKLHGKFFVKKLKLEPWALEAIEILRTEGMRDDDPNPYSPGPIGENETCEEYRIRCVAALRAWEAKHKDTNRRFESVKGAFWVNGVYDSRGTNTLKYNLAQKD